MGHLFAGWCESEILYRDCYKVSQKILLAEFRCCTKQTTIAAGTSKNLNYVDNFFWHPVYLTTIPEILRERVSWFGAYIIGDSGWSQNIGIISGRWEMGPWLEAEQRVLHINALQWLISILCQLLWSNHNVTSHSSTHRFIYIQKMRIVPDLYHLKNWLVLLWFGRFGQWPRPYLAIYILYAMFYLKDGPHVPARGWTLYPSSGGPGRRRRRL